ncbi:phospholipase C [Rhodococcus sp. PvR044]|uniref:phosphocholine-specific phospholipase C n=1 Tax=unclassified Rhodococcus (in: high G+C Gram-positive bacteria) TaxID=192944 RepID=UPI000BD4EB48|nr:MULTISPECIES: phospholipase C, phosphocholine-specific [unclassified Rhodococcus (in: high G+C Gram-positive bacteria)]PTR43071.1 phospholipase C [Rhodococcus sp. OK611]SNX91406.1 phospholipase C [Rhodococcus sp. OK270]
MTRNSLSRRRFLTAGAGAAAAVAATSMLPPSLQRALATPVRPGGLESVEHVVLIMQENRSFDHYYGMLRGVRGFGDPNSLRLRTGASVFEQPGPNGPVLPFPIRDSAAAQRMDTQNVTGLDHSWEGGHQALADGWHDGWIAAKTGTTMAYYDRQDIPFHYELADAFTICDAYHCSVPTSTSPNRNYWVSGYTGFEPAGLLPAGAAGLTGSAGPAGSSEPGPEGRAVTNAAYDPWHAGYGWTTVPERLQAAGISWKTYQEWDNFGDNNLEYFATFKKVGSHLLGNPGLVPYELQTLAGFYLALPELPPAAQDVALGALEVAVNGLSPADRQLYDRGLYRSRPGTLAAEFRKDVESGKLPQVSYLVPPEVDSEHPSGSSPAASATLLYQVLDAIASDPDLWAKTAVIVNFDENDGYFDHVPPPRPPLSVDSEWVAGQPLGLGPRVPMTIISPWTVGGFVCSQVFDHTSVNQFLEKRFGITQPEIDPWRRTVSGDLTSAFDFTNPRSRPNVAQPRPTPPLEPRWTPTPPALQRMPVQEGGTRPARALPYQPDAYATADPGARSVTVHLVNSGAASAHLALYPYAGEFGAPRHYDVRGEIEDTVALPGPRYSLTLLGPNGFRREFAGSTDGAAAALELSTRVDAAAGALDLTVKNPGERGLTVVIDGQRRRLAAGGRESMRVQSVDGWYQATVTVDEDPDFRRTLVGHIENGRAGVSQAV